MRKSRRSVSLNVPTRSFVKRNSNMTQMFSDWRKDASYALGMTNLTTDSLQAIARADNWKYDSSLTNYLRQNFIFISKWSVTWKRTRISDSESPFSIALKIYFIIRNLKKFISNVNRVQNVVRTILNKNSAPSIETPDYRLLPPQFNVNLNYT